MWHSWEHKIIGMENRLLCAKIAGQQGGQEGKKGSRLKCQGQYEKSLSWKCFNLSVLVPVSWLILVFLQDYYHSGKLGKEYKHFSVWLYYMYNYIWFYIFSNYYFITKRISSWKFSDREKLFNKRVWEDRPI